LKAENQQLQVKNRNLRLNLAALHRKIAFIELSDKKKSRELGKLKKENDSLKKQIQKLRKEKEK
jgi:cell division protein FtsB